MKRLLTVLTVAALLLAPAWAQPGKLKKDLCTQGDFALMLATELYDLDSIGPDDRDRQFTPQSAIERLTLVEITPNAGWQADKIVTRKVMQEVLAQIHASYSAQNPNQELTKQEVAGMLRENEHTIYRFLCRGSGRGEQIFTEYIYRPYYSLPAYTK